MFEPFTNVSQFYPGLILWCDLNSYDMEATTLPPNTMFDRKRAHELRPCLVVAVNQETQQLQLARLCATVPTDTRRWVRVDSPPAITWKLPDAWIWVGTPATVDMVLNHSKVMHPHKDAQYITPAVAAANVRNYWVHRKNYMKPGPSAAAHPNVGGPSSHNMSTNQHTTTPYNSPPGSTLYLSNPNPNTLVPSVFNPGQRSNSNATQLSNFNPYPPSGFSSYANMNPNPNMQFNTLAPQPIVLPTGFTETHPNAPGWWRNPETGWFWHASNGLLPPAAMRPQ
ncbi:hypothetical protein DFH06DRAFT_1230548 [Mycena polygramma]|nr:hypothetical protein DFH06DRAFT_1230548 [Mycena polygramma]